MFVGNNMKQAAKKYRQVQDEIKEFLLQQPPQQQIVSNFASYLDTLSSSSIHHLKRSRKSILFNTFYECKKNTTFLSVNNCLNECFYSACYKNVEGILRCMKTSKTPTEGEKCMKKYVQNYYECLYGKANEIYKWRYLQV